MAKRFSKNRQGRPGAVPRSAGLRILAEIRRAAPTICVHSASGRSTSVDSASEVRVMRRHRKAAALALGLVMVGTAAGARAMQGRGAAAAEPRGPSYMHVTEEDVRR